MANFKKKGLAQDFNSWKKDKEKSKVHKKSKPASLTISDLL